MNSTNMLKEFWKNALRYLMFFEKNNRYIRRADIYRRNIERKMNKSIKWKELMKFDVRSFPILSAYRLYQSISGNLPVRIFCEY